MLPIVLVTDNDQFYLILGVSLGILGFFILCIVLYSIFRRRDRTPKDKEIKVKEPKEKAVKVKEPKVKKQAAKEIEVVLTEIPNIYELFGGKENVLSYEQKGSRLIIELNDVDVVNVEEIKKIGVEKVLTMSKKVTLIGDGISNLLNNLENF